MLSETGNKAAVVGGKDGGTCWYTCAGIDISVSLISSCHRPSTHIQGIPTVKMSLTSSYTS